MRGPIAMLVLATTLSGCATTDPAERPSPFPLALPLACTPGEDCWVINHVDLDPGPDRRDYRCGQMSSDGNKGTGIALRNLARLDDDVPVLAAAPGAVVGTRDGMADVSVRVGGVDAVKGRECGNGVRVAHEGGWIVQYCHLKRGSVAVQTGDRVQTGDILGAVGLSGMTDFPHLQVRIEKDGHPVDPFRGLDGGPECGRGTAPLWDADARRMLVDHAPILLDAGFAVGPLTRDDAESGTAGRDTAGTDASALTVWTRTAGIEPGDLLVTTIVGPHGEALLADLWRADENHLLAFRYVGRKRPAAGWPVGAYTARVILKRGEQRSRSKDLVIRIAPQS